MEETPHPFTTDIPHKSPLWMCLCACVYVSHFHLEVIAALHSSTGVKCFPSVMGKVPHVHSGRVGMAAAHPQLNTDSILTLSARPPQPSSYSVTIPTAGHRVCECGKSARCRSVIEGILVLKR